MNIKHITVKSVRQSYKKTVRWLITQEYIRKKPVYEVVSSYQPGKLAIITVAFNNPYLIENQITLFNKHIMDPFYLLVADNSTDDEQSRKIMEICSKSEIQYVKLPNQPSYLNAPSISHGFALNWIFRNYIKRIKPDYWGFIDHDVFPVEKSEITRHLETAPFWGLIHIKCNRWYLWPGFSFFNGKQVNSKPLNFSIASGFEKDLNNFYYLDTGGMNYFKLFKNYNLTEIEQPSHKLIRIQDGDIHEKSFVERIDTFVHTINGSNWFKDDLIDEKIKKIEDMKFV